MLSITQNFLRSPANRSACYTYPIEYGSFTKTYLTSAERNAELNHILDSYTNNMAGTYKHTSDNYNLLSYGFTVYQQPAFLMETLAYYMNDPSGHLPWFLQIEVAPYLTNAKTALYAAGIGGMKHPHFTESYYLLATNLS